MLLPVVLFGGEWHEGSRRAPWTTTGLGKLVLGRHSGVAGSEARSKNRLRARLAAENAADGGKNIEHARRKALRQELGTRHARQMHGSCERLHANCANRGAACALVWQADARGHCYLQPPPYGFERQRRTLPLGPLSDIQRTATIWTRFSCLSVCGTVRRVV